NEVNLEHVLPQNPGAGWGGDTPDTADAYYKRIGNLALLKSNVNNNIGNTSFTDKKPHYTASEYVLTKNITKYNSWEPKDIEDRQAALANLAVKTWPL